MDLTEFFEIIKFSDKIVVKMVFEPATSCLRVKYASIAPGRYR